MRKVSSIHEILRSDKNIQYNGKGDPSKKINIDVGSLSVGREVDPQPPQCEKCGAVSHITKNCVVGKNMCFVPGCNSRTHSSEEHPRNTPKKESKKSKNKIGYVMARYRQVSDTACN